MTFENKKYKTKYDVLLAEEKVSLCQSTGAGGLSMLSSYKMAV